MRLFQRNHGDWIAATEENILMYDLAHRAGMHPDDFAHTVKYHMDKGIMIYVFVRNPKKVWWRRWLKK